MFVIGVGEANNLLKKRVFVFFGLLYKLLIHFAPRLFASPTASFRMIDSQTLELILKKPPKLIIVFMHHLNV